MADNKPSLDMLEAIEKAMTLLNQADQHLSKAYNDSSTNVGKSEVIESANATHATFCNLVRLMAKYADADEGYHDHFDKRQAAGREPDTYTRYLYMKMAE